MCYIYIVEAYFVKCFKMYIQMYWLLIKKEYIIVFVYIITAIIFYAARVTSAKRVAHVHSNPGQIVPNPRPNGIIVNLVYSNHV